MNTNTELFKRAGSDIAVSELHNTYRIGEQIFMALGGISCRVQSGKVTVVQGPSGCGKTTLMNILGGVDTCDSGSVKIGTYDLTAQKQERVLAHYRLNDVGFVFQAFNLIPGLTALDNLQLPMTVLGKSARECSERGSALLGLVGMSEKRNKRPDELSGGEQQRVAIALALVNDPPLILADEPTGNLDTNNATLVTDLLCTLAHKFGKTVVITTHDPRVGERGDQDLHMRDGLIQAA
jgi:putative ABC transport system ATP-binding protein